MSERVASENFENRHEGNRHHDGEKPAVPEGLTEHKDGESAGEWLKNDAAQTKEDLHIGNKDKH